MKSKTMFLTATLFLIAAVVSCDKKDAPALPDVNSSTVIDPALYEKTNPMLVSDVRVIGDVMQVKISASGCDGSTWKARLIDSGSIAKSNPVQRKAKIEFTNMEACLAFFSKIFIFDLKPLRVGSSNEVNVILDLGNGKTESVLYKY